jgi:hypothetical protein
MPLCPNMANTRLKVVQHGLTIRECAGAAHCPYKCDGGYWEVVEGDWERDVALPNNRRAVGDLAVAASAAMRESRRFLELARAARIAGVTALARRAATFAAEARLRAAKALRERCACLNRIADIEARLAARAAANAKEAA